MKIKEIKKEDTFEIAGHSFNGLEDLEKAVEVETKITNSIGERYIRELNPEKPIKGLHVLRLYEPYPCFDSSDRLYENRRYQNYFFSEKPFSEEEINRLAELPCQINYCMVNEELDSNELPAIYFGGSSYHKLKIATN